jgi:hypothetical protein
MDEPDNFFIRRLFGQIWSVTGNLNFLFMRTIVIAKRFSIALVMTEYALNRFNTTQLAEFAHSSAMYLTTVESSTVKIDLYHTERHFVEISYSLRKGMDGKHNWKLYSANHYPDAPSSTKYLTFFLDQIELSVR